MYATYHSCDPLKTRVRPALFIGFHLDPVADPATAFARGGGAKYSSFGYFQPPRRLSRGHGEGGGLSLFPSPASAHVKTFLLVSQAIKKPDQLVPYFVMDVARVVPGLPGLFVAGVFSAALRSVPLVLLVLPVVPGVRLPFGP